jgi:Subtilisin-like serine proteases
LLGCEKRELTPDNNREQVEHKSDIITGNRIKVKFSPDFGENFTEIKNSVATKSSDNSAVSDVLMQIGASNMRRLFTYNEEYDNLMRKHGLHLWYVVEFDEGAAVTKSVLDIKSIKGIDIVEKIVSPVCSVKPFSASFFNNNRPVTMSNYVMTGPNDPRYKEQWNFKNRGQSSVQGSVAGADINIEEAWKIETGDPRVIVAVIDGGIDIKHPDLVDNLYTVNTDYKDEFKDEGKHGYNFCKKILRKYQAYEGGMLVDKAERDPKQDEVELTAHFHGTHVAGTVAAKNNNGLGVCGVAGGNGDPNSGARLLSCQIMDNWGGSDYYENAFVYAQIRGAVIAQCSWGWPMESGYTWGMFNTIYGDKSMSLKAAIDYFIEFAGCDKDGKQREGSLMKGGLVVFAAGNEPYEFQSFPACYDKVIAVTAMSPSFKRSSFTTYGDWADIMAPGGNGAEGVSDPGNVLSTYPMSAGGYAFLPGTSMACPHVAGVAALVVSKFGGEDFTADSLKKQVLSALRPYDLYKYNNEPKYKGKLGKGYIDAYRALKVNENKNPDKVAKMNIEPLFKEVNFSWTAVNDPDDGTADFYDLYYSTTQLTESNYMSADKMETFFAEAVKKGRLLNVLLKGLNLILSTILQLLQEIGGD